MLERFQVISDKLMSSRSVLTGNVEKNVSEKCHKTEYGSAM